MASFWLPQKIFSVAQEQALVKIFEQHGFPPEKIPTIVWRLHRAACISFAFRENQKTAQSSAEIRAELNTVHECISRFLGINAFSAFQALHCSFSNVGPDTRLRLSVARQLGGAYTNQLEDELAQLVGTVARIEAELKKLVDGIDALPKRSTGRGRKPGSNDEVVHALVYAICATLAEFGGEFPPPTLFYNTISIIEGLEDPKLRPFKTQFESVRSFFQSQA